MENLFVYISNAAIATFYYIQNYFWYLLALGLFIVAGFIELHEKRFLFVDDERKVI